MIIRNHASKDNPKIKFPFITIYGFLVFSLSENFDNFARF